MTDTPRSEVHLSRFSTPVDELDDHRFQQEHLPRADTMGSANRGSRRGTANSVTVERPDLLQVNDSLRNGWVARDFEQAIVDDDRSEQASLYGHDGSGERASPSSPRVARRSTFRRPQPPYLDATANRSRTSTIVSREDSLSNSVDAFAEPRTRARADTANTAGSLMLPSPYVAPRAQSDTNGRRRLTFNDSKPYDVQADETSSEGSVEDDVCFPEPEAPKKIYTIDFDALQEFVDEQREQTTIPQDMRRKCSFSCQSRVPGPMTRNAGPAAANAATTAIIDLPILINDELVAHDSSETAIGESSPEMDPEEEKLHHRHHLHLHHHHECSPECPSQQKPKQPLHRWSFFSSEHEESVHSTDLGDLLLPGQTFFDLFALGPEDGVWWLDMLEPTEDEIEVICKAFGVHRLTREDILEQETREKVELFKSYYFVCFRSFVSDPDAEDYLEPVHFYAVVFQEGILTFSFRASPHASNVRKRMGRLRDYASLGSNWICYALVDDIVDLFAPSIESIEHETDAIEDDVFTVRPEDSRVLLRKIGQCRKKVMSLLRLLGAKADVIKGFAKRCNENYAIAPRQDIGLYLSDVQDHVVTMMGSLGHFEKMLSRSHANYLAQISADGMVQGNRTNRALGKVTLIATILVPLNLVTGLFGMNVEVPGKNATTLAWWFGIVGFMVVFSSVSYAFARRARWF